MALKESKVAQYKLKTVRDLRHHLKVHGLTRHLVHDSETDWWWFADNRNRLLEEVFNSGSRVVFALKRAATDGSDEIWDVQSDLIAHVKGFRLQTLFLTSKMTDDLLTNLFWTDFLNQDRERFAYWDMENPDNGFDEYLFYREMRETGAHLEKGKAEVFPAARTHLRVMSTKQKRLASKPPARE